MDSVLFNPNVRRYAAESKSGKRPLDFHKRMPGYAPTPLVRSPAAEAVLGFGDVWVKDESNRFGLPSFKILGASWAVYRNLEERFGVRFDSWDDLEQLKNHIGKPCGVRLVTATDGNHGRGVARVASWFGMDALVFVPRGTVGARIEAIESEGARVIVIDGDYDDAVVAAADEQNEGTWLIQDTGWPGYETVPGWIIEGYSTIFHETHDQLTSTEACDPGLVAVQIGVGSLAASVVGFFRYGGGASTPAIVGVEPAGAACAFESVRRDRIVTVPGPHSSVMAGLNCGTLSTVAWPLIRGGIDVFTRINDAKAFEAMRILAHDGIISGESGAAALAGLLELFGSGEGDELVRRCGIDRSGGILVVSTEGATDPDLYGRIVGSTT
jgi:diaminopropionate ammonia-lyase